MWMYHSHVDEVRDINTGLFGPMIITARGKARADGLPNDVDREIVASFMQVHEEDSWLAKENLPPAALVLSSAAPGAEARPLLLWAPRQPVAGSSLRTFSPFRSRATSLCAVRIRLASPLLGRVAA